MFMCIYIYIYIYIYVYTHTSRRSSRYQGSKWLELRCGDRRLKRKL